MSISAFTVHDKEIYYGPAFWWRRARRWPAQEDGLVVAVVALLGGVPTTGRDSDADPAQGTATPPASDDDARAPDAGLPFSLDGVSYDASLSGVGDGISEAKPADTWEFGGDNARIDSFLWMGVPSLGLRPTTQMK